MNNVSSMSIPRLNFLYPHLFKPARIYEPALVQGPPRAVRKRPQKQCFSTTHRRSEETYAQRYGPAAEPLPPPLVPNDLGRQRALDSIEIEIPSSASIQEVEKVGQPKDPAKAVQQDETSSKGKFEPKEDSRPTELDANEAKAQELVNSAQKEAISKPLDKVLQIETPTQTKNEEEQKPPHLEAPRYVHHFDTFTQVRDLAKGGFTEAQSVTLMKAVRSLLAMNMEVARAGLVSKSDVENVTFTNIPLPPPPSPILQPPTTSLTPFSSQTEKLPLPRRLLRTPHRNPQHTQIHLRENDHPARTLATRSRHPLATLLVRKPRAQRRLARAPQRPQDGRAHGAAAAGQPNPGAEL